MEPLLSISGELVTLGADCEAPRAKRKDLLRVKQTYKTNKKTKT